MTEGAELPASWQVGDAALPTSLEERKAFLGLDDLPMDKKRGSHMGEPKVERHQKFQSAFYLLINYNLTQAQILDTISLFNYVLRPQGPLLLLPGTLSKLLAAQCPTN